MSGTAGDNPYDIPTRSVFEVEVVVEQGPSAGERHVLRRFPAFLGRGQDADMRLADDPSDPTLSRRHLRLTVESGHVVATDVSTNGTWVGERQLAPDEKVVLADGDEVWLGPRTMIVVRARRSGTPPVRSPGGTVDRPPGPPEGHEVTASDRGPGSSADDGRVLLHASMLGALRVVVGGRPVPESAWPSRKAAVLLAFLADAAGRSIPAERVADTLWPDAIEGARAVLQTTVSRVRKAFRSVDDGLPDPIEHDRTGYRIGTGYDLHCDTREFERLCAGGDTDGLERAVRLYEGPFLEGQAEDWVQSRRRVLETMYLDAVDTVADNWERAGRLPDAIRLYERVLEHEPCREQTQLGLLRALVASGRRDEAVRRYHGFVRLLKKTLGIGPSPPLVSLYLSLRE